MIAFGPVPSRRLGRSLGINSIPPKACTYSCTYCQVGAESGLVSLTRTVNMWAEPRRRQASRCRDALTPSQCHTPAVTLSLQAAARPILIQVSRTKG